MIPDIITTALDPEGKRTHIDKAKRNVRYRGATPHHQDCELYPVIRKTKRSSFAHVPKQVDACNRGESAIHRKACENWMKFFESQLNGCLLCRSRGEVLTDHICPVLRFQDGVLTQAPVRDPIYGEIVWTCGKCLRVHMWDLLDEVSRVISNKRVPGLNSRIRPDITLLDEDDEVTAFLEFRKSHLSDVVKETAERLSIPLFVVDIENSLAEFQAGLNNPHRGVWGSIAPSSIDREMEEATFQFRESMGKNGGVSGSFSTILGEDGKLADVVFHAVGKSDVLPGPSIGRYLVAGESNLSCESQMRRMIPSDSKSITP